RDVLSFRAPGVRRAGRHALAQPRRNPMQTTDSIQPQPRIAKRTEVLPKSERLSGSDHDGALKQETGVLYLGIDLGTSRTSVSASNGVRESMPSFVGYPKDVVSRKLLKKEILFGDEAIEKRLSLELFRPLGEGVIKGSNDEKNGNGKASEADGNLRAARDLISEIIRRAKPRKDE